MARRTDAKPKAYAVFDTNIDRAEAFLRLFNAFRGDRGQPTNDEKELLRGAVVFAIGALDAVLHELVLELVPERGATSAMSTGLREIAREDPALALRCAIAVDHDLAKAEFRKALDDWLSMKAFHGPEAVVRAATYVGCSFDWKAVNQATQLQAPERLQHYTDMRHDVVHRGRKPRVKREHVQECIKLIRGIVDELQAETGNSLA